MDHRISSMATENGTDHKISVWATKKGMDHRISSMATEKKKQDIILLNQVSFVAIMTRRNAPGYIILNRRRFPVLTRLKCIEQPLPL